MTVRISHFIFHRGRGGGERTQSSSDGAWPWGGGRVRRWAATEASAARSLPSYTRVLASSMMSSAMRC
eukprot:812319-Prorocentrum_minimum.AAC.1